MNTNNENNSINLKNLFSVTGIERVICVDDQYRKYTDEDVNEAIGVFSILEKEEINKLINIAPELKNIRFSQNEKIWKKELTQSWQQWDTEIRKKIFNLCNIDQSENSLKDSDSADILKKIIVGNSDAEFLELSLADWNSGEQDYLNHKNIPKTLFLFDQNFSNEDGGTSDTGIKIIKNILENTPNAICGLLSHTFASETETDYWQDFSTFHNIDKDRFVLISKTRLNEEKNSFIVSIRRTLLSKEFKDLKIKVSNILNEAAKNSQERVDQLNVYDFEHIVFYSSYYEGIWEPETLLRLYGFYHREETLTKAKSSSRIHELSNKIRQLLPKNPSNNSVYQTSKKIRHQELYEDAENLNSLHMPIECGDIFQKKDNDKKFLLLNQPCDLMIRSTGKRKSTIYEVTLAEIEQTNSNESPAHYKLKYFSEEGEDNYIVNFSKTHSVKLCILDLCVYQKDGSATFTSKQKCPDIIIPSWRRHFEKLQKKFQKIIQEHKKIDKINFENKNEKKRIQKLILPQSNYNNQTPLFRVEFQSSQSEDVISYNCKRIKRLRKPLSGEILLKYANYISRMAFEHDFGREF